MTAVLLNQVACGSLAHRCGLRAECSMLACFTEVQDASQEAYLRAWQHP